MVEDIAGVGSSLVELLKHEGYGASLCGANVADRVVQKCGPSLIIIDTALPNGLGAQFLGRANRLGLRTPTMVISMNSTAADRLLAFRLGACDYMAKPFAMEELLARIRVHLACGTIPASSTLTFGDLSINVELETAHLSDVLLPLTPKEFALLAVLVKGGGALITKERIYVDVWGYRAKPQSRAVDFHVAQLRRKLSSNGDPPEILTVRGRGFLLARRIGNL